MDMLADEVYFVGENGQGKSNLLEALYIAAYGSSFRTRNDTEIVTEGQNDYSVRVMFRDGSNHTASVSVFYANGKKRIEKNGKTVTDRKDIINTIPCVLFCHDDMQFAVGAPEERRWFIDQTLSMYDIMYVDLLRRYKRILKSRNLVLKDRDTRMLDVYDSQLAEAGIDIQKKRREAIETFNKIFGNLYLHVTGIDQVKVSYSPSWKGYTVTEALETLAQKRETDLSMGTTFSGPHRDRIRFLRGGKPFIPSASTGQRRLVSILLRIAQAVFYTEYTGKLPVLLMDDVMLELDPDKRQKVTALLPRYDQLFCTFLPGEPYERYRKENTKVYQIEGGKWHG
jgi:DNA replication and repair protein RecF